MKHRYIERHNVIQAVERDKDMPWSVTAESRVLKIRDRVEGISSTCMYVCTADSSLRVTGKLDV